ncbi:MAG: hypothetical protein ABJB66_02190, partial [Gemmatimonadaceae bacterium]
MAHFRRKVSTIGEYWCMPLSNRTTFKALAALAFACLASSTAISAAAQTVIVKSADGMAVLRYPSSATPKTPIRISKDTSTDDPAIVVGTRYRIEPANAVLPKSSTFSIHWEMDSVPGGAAVASLRLVRHDATWVQVHSVDAEAQTFAALIAGGGSYAIRWNAQSNCSGAEARALDFRVGTWDYRAKGYDPGRSAVTIDASRCAVFDDYVDIKGGRSRSFFLFSSIEKKWFATTYDPGGRSVMQGVLEPNGMAFYHSTIDRETYHKQN